MRGPPEPYVPGRPSPPAEPDEEPWPPRIYVPGPADPGAEQELSARDRRRLRELIGAPPDRGAGERHVLALLREPDLLDAVLGRLAREARDRDAGRVAASETRGWLLAAPLAARTGLPLVALRAKRPVRGETAGPCALAADEEAIAGDRVLVVDVVLADVGPLRAAIRALEGAGAVVAGAAVLAAEADETGSTVDDVNLLSLLEL